MEGTWYRYEVSWSPDRIIHLQGHERPVGMERVPARNPWGLALCLPVSGLFLSASRSAIKLLPGLTLAVIDSKPAAHTRGWSPSYI